MTRIFWPLGLAALGLSALALGGCGSDDSPPAEGPTDLGVTPDTCPETDLAAAPDLGSPEEDLGGPAADLGPTTLCREGETRCWGERLGVCLEGGVGWFVEACPEGRLCVEGACQERECLEGDLRCSDDGVQRCLPERWVWSETQPCAEGESCRDGVCLPRSCEPGELLCGRARLLRCADDGLGWDEEACPEDFVCFDGRCRACLNDEHCAAGARCVDGECQPLPLSLVPGELPAGMEGEAYEAQLEAQGGQPPYVFAVAEGDLPPGLSLSGAGLLSGLPEQTGEFPLVLRVEDEGGASAQGERVLRIHGSGLVVASEALPPAEEGVDYAARLEALGGTPPYAWMIAAGALPAGLQLGAGGGIAGIPSEIGEFPITVKVFDNSAPPQMAQRDLSLQVRIAPLEIFGDQEFDLFVLKVVTLPMITVVEGIPIPYSTQLGARGGLRPYHWLETELPAMLRPYIPLAGIPEGLTLSEDGLLQGAVTSTERVVRLTIPFTQITLTGFFFFAQVQDSQDPAESRTALFLLPTLPLGGAPAN